MPNALGGHLTTIPAEYDPLADFERNPKVEISLPDSAPKRKLLLFSFGHRYGLPRKFGPLETGEGEPPGAHLVVDARILPNPPREIRIAHTGLSETFQQTLFADEKCALFYEHTLSKIKTFLAEEVPKLDPHANVNIGIGCEMGRHRSVATVERLARDLSLLYKNDWDIQILHRDLNKKKKKRDGPKVKVPWNLS